MPSTDRHRHRFSSQAPSVESTHLQGNFLWQVGKVRTHLFNSPFSGTTRVSRYQKGKTNLDFTETRDSEWQWYQLGLEQVCTSLQIDNHASTPLLSFLHARCPSCRPTNSVKALKAEVGKGICISNFSSGVGWMPSVL